MKTEPKPVYTHPGFCPICEQHVSFFANNYNYRGSLRCPKCINGSVPRDRAIALVIKRLLPDWRNKIIHESSPNGRGFSVELRKECKKYVQSQYFPDKAPGEMVNGFRNENLENQTYEDERFDLSISLDVLEHVNDPEKVFIETARTLKLGGFCIFTAPTYPGKVKSERRARINAHGVEEILVGKAEYHGSPVNSKGSLVTFHYGYDFPQMIFSASKMSVEVARFWDPYYGIIGPMTEVYICTKR